MGEFYSDRALCVNADKSAIVDCDSIEARYVLVGPGGRVSAEDAERYGLGGDAPQPQPPTEGHIMDPTPTGSDASSISVGADEDADETDGLDGKAKSAAPANKARPAGVNKDRE